MLHDESYLLILHDETFVDVALWNIFGDAA